MANYKQSEILGSSYQRTHKITIDNPYGGVPAIEFQEEQILNLGNEIIHRPGAGMRIGFNPDAVIHIRNPETDEDTGQTVSLGAIYAMIYSLYMAEAEKRDQVQGAPE